MKTILLTGATDGIGLETAKMLAEAGHRVLLHGRNADKLKRTAEAIAHAPAYAGGARPETLRADLADMGQVRALAAEVRAKHAALDVLINNAGVFKVPPERAVTASGLDIRFAVNVVAPYLLMRLLMPALEAAEGARVVNLSSAAQSPVDLGELQRSGSLGDSAAYAQSKLALTMWSRALADKLAEAGSDVSVVSVNPSG